MLFRSERLFRNIIRESLGRYSKYIVMNFHNEIFSDILNQIGSDHLLLLDFCKFEKGDLSYIAQDFDEGFYFGLVQARSQFLKYRKLILVFPSDSKHPQGSKDYFIRFCNELGRDYEIIESVANRPLRPYEAYLVFSMPDLVELIKRVRAHGARIGQDIGVLAYNDNPSFEVIDNGITSLSVDFCEMGRMAAEFVLDNRSVRLTLPTRLRLRNSL